MRHRLRRPPAGLDAGRGGVDEIGYFFQGFHRIFDAKARSRRRSRRDLLGRWKSGATNAFARHLLCRRRSMGIIPVIFLDVSHQTELRRSLANSRQTRKNECLPTGTRGIKAHPSSLQSLRDLRFLRPFASEFPSSALPNSPHYGGGRGATYFPFPNGSFPSPRGLTGPSPATFS
jgi:hypothetical protein